ncbi:MAG TPA: hypothetical protein PKC39_09490 [Ferruginibacter sp.]|nr:hypothetical protein [Ferruginibacter sp.]HMP21180.1 hypothetical protein [Ferruginibacter sp.]
MMQELNKNYHKVIRTAIVVLLTACTGSSIYAQKENDKKQQAIEITSSYKPVLRNAAKISFSAAQLPSDTSRQVSAYNIPAQNLFYTYQPGTLRPLALEQDSVTALGIRNFIKAGFGNYSTPYVKAGFSFGDGEKALLNIYGDYISSKGSILHQDYSRGSVKAAGSYFTDKVEVYGNAEVRQQDFYFYGYDHNTFNYTKTDVLQRFNDVNVKLGVRNKEETALGIHYNPAITFSLFNIKDRVLEETMLLDAPAEVPLNEELSLRVAVKADLTAYSTKFVSDNVSFANNIFQVAPQVVYARDLFNIHVGISPTWDNSKLSVLPNIYGEAKFNDLPFLIQAGLTGRFIKNTMRNLTALNPWLQAVSVQQNTRETELYGGIKATFNKHFNFSAKAGLISYSNFPFFINDTTDGKTFYISNEGKLSNLRLHADLSFISQEKFTITGGITFNGYTGMRDNAKAWGTIPLELNASMRWWAFKRLLIKSDFMAFSGGPYLLKDGINKTLSGAADLSAGAEYSITPSISAWLDFNNIFNNKYQRWNNYQVYGLNVLGGVVVRF